MKAAVRVAAMRQKIDIPNSVIVNACSNTAVDWQKDLSPFFLGPCWLYEKHWAKRMENAWQYSKLYAEHADEDGCATEEYWDWAQAGWDNDKAVRFPMGKGAKPLGCLWRGKKYGYVESRKLIYGPLYRDAVMKTEGWIQLRDLHSNMHEVSTLVLRDFDGYDHIALGMSLTDVLNNPNRKMGHAFVLAMALTNDPAFLQLRLDVSGAESSPPERWFEKEEQNDPLERIAG